MYRIITYEGTKVFKDLDSRLPIMKKYIDKKENLYVCDNKTALDVFNYLLVNHEKDEYINVFKHDSDVYFQKTSEKFEETLSNVKISYNTLRKIMCEVLEELAQLENHYNKQAKEFIELVTDRVKKKLIKKD